MKKLLIIGLIWPEPNSTAAGARMIQLIELFKLANYHITFVSTSTKVPNSFDLNKLNIQTFNIQLNSADFDKLVKQIDPTIVLFDRFLTEEQFGWRISENCPNALKILDTEDLHFLRNARQTAYKNGEEMSLNLLINDITKREIASIYRCDISLIISKYEIKFLKNQFKIPKSILHYTPFLLDNISENTLEKYPSFSNRAHFISIGNFKHEPNWNAVLYLKSTIWPLIKNKLSNAEIHIYGAYTTDKVKQLHNEKEGFLIKGWAENTKNTFTNAKICLAPLQFGAGLKGKLIDAMLYGTPSVTTSIGAEGMHKNSPWNGFISNNPNEFALNAVELYNNETLWKNAQKNGIEIINSCFSKTKHSHKLLNRIDFIYNNLEEHRLQNFTGEMLKHHTLKSTKYLSKWIEEKNKNN
jgi:glycosyltransferase involved in cell wall biosynthesis